MSELPLNDRLSGPFIATAGQTDFPADFPLIDAAALRVQRERAGVLTVLEPPAVEAVAVGEASFTARLAAGALAGDRIHVFTDLAPARERAHVANGAVRTKTLEDDARDAYALHQERARDIGRSLTAPLGETWADLPPAAARAGKVLGFDEAGAPIVQSVADAGGVDPALVGAAVAEAVAPFEDQIASKANAVAVAEALDGKADAAVVVRLDGANIDPTARTALRGALDIGEGGDVDAAAVIAAGEDFDTGQKTAFRAAIDTPSRAGAGVSSIPFKAALNVWFLTFEDYGAVGDGTTNDRVAMQNAIDAAALLKGASIRMRPGKNYLCKGGHLVVKEGVYIVGDLSLPGVPGASNAELSAVWTKLASRLIIDPLYSIKLKGSAGLIGLFVVREGLTAQVLAHDAATRDAAFVGTQILVEGEDTLCRDLLCLGGEYVWRNLGYNRAMAFNIRWDAKEGFQSALSLDRAIMADLHGWPFVTFGQLGNASSGPDHQDHRPGVAYRLSGTNDWIEFQRLFEYGHFKGFLLEVHPLGSAPLTVTFNGCGKDNLAFPPSVPLSASPWVIPGSIGVEITGATDELRIFGMTVAATDLAYSITMTAPQAQVVLYGSTAHGCRNGIKVNGGTVRVTAGWIRGLLGVYGVTDAATQGGTGIEVVSGTVISDRSFEVEKFTTAMDGNDVGGAFIGFPFIRDGGIAQIALHPVVVSGAGTAAPSINHDQQILTGHTTLGTLGQTRNGHVVQFYFDGPITVLAAGNIKLNGGADLACNVRDVLTLMDAGNVWVEVARGQAL